MPLRLVYRALRKISDWSLSFYSDVYVEGQENVPVDGPVILAATHHNEMIDIATLAATIPHRRPVRFWAKSTMFKNPISGWILSSSGSIPVNRNPNSVRFAEEGKEKGSQSSDIHNALFKETFQALDDGEVIGVFPEGTSYTEPQIAQVKDGAAWAAFEYVRWQREKGTNHKNGRKVKPLTVVPVAIVYTDKAQYQSRVCVRWGKPIDVAPYVDEFLNSSVDSRFIIKKLTQEIESSLVAMTLNAPSWNMLYQAHMVRDIIWNGEENVPAKDYVHVTRRIIGQISTHRHNDSLAEDLESLLTYNSLSHYTAIPHGTLVSLYPEGVSQLNRTRSLRIFIGQLLYSLLHPRFILFFPTFLVHLPAYLCGHLAGRYLANPEEEETQTQFKAIFGGLGFGLVSGFVGKKLSELLSVSSVHSTRQVASLPFATWLFDAHSETASGSEWRRVLGTMAIMLGTTKVFHEWHRALIAGNYWQFKRLATSFKVLISLLWSPSTELSASELEFYSRPKPRPVNPYIKRRPEVEIITLPRCDTSGENSTPPALTPRSSAGVKPTLFWGAATSRLLVLRLLAARVEATTAARKFTGNENH